MSDMINALSPTVDEPIQRRDLLRRPVEQAEPPVRVEWQELGLAVDALSVRRDTLVMQFVGPVRSVGTTVVATGYAHAAAQRAAGFRSGDAGSRKPVLLVDCSPISVATRKPHCHVARPETVFEAYQRDPNLETILGVTIDRGLSKVRLDMIDGAGSARCSRQAIAEIITLLRGRYSLVVLDCPAISESIVGLELAAHSDGTIIVVRAGTTKSAELNSSRVRLEQVGGEILGVVFNRARVNSRWWSRRGLR